MNSGKPSKQALAIAYSMKRKGKKMYKGGQVQDGGDQMIMHEELPGVRVSEEVLQRQAYKPHNTAVQGYAEGGEVDAMKPLHTKPIADSEGIEEMHPEQEDHLPMPRMEPVQRMDSDLQRDPPRLSESLSLAQDIMLDRKRRKFAQGGEVSSQGSVSGKAPRRDEELSMRDGSHSLHDVSEDAMEVGSLQDSIDAPDMSDLSNNSDELDAPMEDGRSERGLDLEPVHIMSDDEHDTSDASLVSDILKDRKMRRRGR